MKDRSRLVGILGVVASVLGIFFAGFSTHDYAARLDRQLHGTNCSFIPGLSDLQKGENACTAAMYSTYSALFRDRYWGGVPISLFAVGIYAFFLATSLYFLMANRRTSRWARRSFGVLALTPLVVSVIMFSISLTQLGGQFCKLCVGLYVTSMILAAAGVLALLDGFKKVDPSATLVDDDPYGARAGRTDAPRNVRKGTDRAPAYGYPNGSPLILAVMMALAALFTVAPAAAYVSALPSYKQHLLSCGKITELDEKHGALLKIPTTNPVQPALTFEDPLCPTCRAFHDRLVTEGLFEKLDLTIAMFPLDSECNWMLDKPLHPGACVLAKAVLCGDKSGKSRQILEWSYENQEELRDAGKAGNAQIRAKVKERFPEVDACIDAKETKQRMDHILQFAVTNKIRVSTPQLFLGDTRVCDEDTDLGLRYTFAELAPKVKP